MSYIPFGGHTNAPDPHPQYLTQSEAALIYAPIGSGGGGGGGLSFITVEISLGNKARDSGSFTITGLGFVPGKPVMIQQSYGAYSGKGDLPDEAEMDQLIAVARVVSETEIRGYWRSTGPMMGNIKLDYAIGA